MKTEQKRPHIGQVLYNQSVCVQLNKNFALLPQRNILLFNYKGATLFWLKNATFCLYGNLKQLGLITLVYVNRVELSTRMLYFCMNLTYVMIATMYFIPWCWHINIVCLGWIVFLHQLLGYHHHPDFGATSSTMLIAEWILNNVAILVLKRGLNDKMQMLLV